MAKGPRKKSATQVVLIRETCLRMSGPVAFTGELLLSQEELRFVPTRKFERLLGARRIRIPVADIREVSVLQFGKKLEVQTEKGPQNFLGEGACKVGARLWALILERDGKNVEEVGYHLGERVFFSGKVDVLYDRPIAANAELSDRRLRLVPRGSSKTEPRILDISLSEIESVDIQVAKRELSLFLNEDQTVVFGDPTGDGVRDGELVESREMVRLKGPLVPKLYGQLKVLGVCDVDVESEEGEILIDEDKAGLFRGLVSHYGYLVASRAALSFVPTGKLDGVFGAEPVDIRYSEISILEVRSNPESRLVVGVQGEEHIFTVPAAMNWFARLSKVLLKLGLSEEPEISRDGQLKDEAIARKLDDWAPHLTAKMSYGVMFGGPVLCWMSDSALHRGTLVLTQTGVLFLPDSGKEESLLHVRVEDMRRSTDEDEKGDEVVFYADGIEYRFVPLGGVVFSFMFWARYDQRQRAGKLLAAGTAIKNMKGKCQGLRITSPEGEIMVLGALVVPIKSNIGVVVPSGLEQSLEKGSPVSVEVSRGEGLYRFSTSVAREFQGVVPEPSSDEVMDGEEEKSSSASVLVLKTPGGIYFQNRRGEFRVFYEEILVRVICVDIPEDEEGHEDAPRIRHCRMLNLSAHGCLLDSQISFQHGTRVLIELPVTLGTIDIPAKCVRAVPPFGDRTNYAFGFAFGELREGYRDRIYRIMYRQQGAEKRQKEVDIFKKQVYEDSLKGDGDAGGKGG